MHPDHVDVFLPPRLSWIFNLPEDEHSALDFLKGYSGRGFHALPGVYFLWQDLQLVYIGKSDRSVANRVDTHYREGKKEFNDVSAFYAESPEEIKYVGELETAMINRFYPRYNAPYPHRQCIFCDRALGGVSFETISGQSFCGRCMHDFHVFQSLVDMKLMDSRGEILPHFSMWVHIILQRIAQRDSVKGGPNP